MSGAVYTDDKGAVIGITIVFTFLVLIDLIGNSMVIAIMAINKSMRTPMNYLLINLAVADILVAIFIASRFIFSPFLAHPDGFVGTVICKHVTGGSFKWMAGNASVFLLVAVCFERYFAIVHPFSLKFRLTAKKAKIIALVCWISSAVLNIPGFMLMSYDEKSNFCMETWPKHLTWLVEAFSFVYLVVIGCLPSTTMFVLYSRVVYKLWFKQDVEGTQLAVRKSRKRITKMVITISIIYGLTWLPNLTIYALVHNLPGYQYGDFIHIFSMVLVTCNSAINPFVYTLHSEKFRRNMWELVCCRRFCSNKADVNTNNSSNTNTLPRGRVENDSRAVE